MTEGLEAITRQAVSLALDAASLRQQVSAANIANANVLGYAPQRVSFEAQLAEARRTLRDDGAIDPASLAQVRPVIELDDGAGAVVGTAAGEGVRLDVEAAQMARNAVHYQALVKGLSHQLSLLSIAAGDGRR